MNKKQLAAEQMKLRIIEATIEIVGTGGFSKLTAAALSKKTGASKGVLYHHFENLVAIQLAALQYLVDSMIAINEDKSPFPSLAEYLDCIGEETFSALDASPVEIKALVAFIQEAMFEPAFGEKVQVLMQETFKRYSQTIQYLLPSLSETELETVVQMIDAHFGGAMIHWYLLGDQQKCRESWRLFSEMLCRSLSKGQ